jgi:hypothetical protein
LASPVNAATASSFTGSACTGGAENQRV